MIMLIIFCMLYCSPVTSTSMDNKCIQAQSSSNSLLVNKIIDCFSYKECGFIKNDTRKIILYVLTQCLCEINQGSKKTALNKLNNEIDIFKKYPLSSIKTKELKTKIRELKKDFKNLKKIKDTAFRNYSFMSRTPIIFQKILFKDDVEKLFTPNLIFEGYDINVILKELAPYENRDNLAIFLLKLILYRDQRGEESCILPYLTYDSLKKYCCNNKKIKIEDESGVLSSISFVDKELENKNLIYSNLLDKVNSFHKIYCSMKDFSIKYKIHYGPFVEFILSYFKQYEYQKNFSNTLKNVIDNRKKKFRIMSCIRKGNDCNFNESEFFLFGELVCKRFSLKNNDSFKLFLLQFLQCKMIMGDCMCEFQKLLNKKLEEDNKLIEFKGGNVFLFFDKSLQKEYMENILVYEVFLYNYFVSELRNIINR